MSDVAQLVAPEPVALNEAVGRFRREAVPGRFDTGRYHCSYYTWGDGPPLLCIPGLSDDAHSFVMLAAALAGDFRCILYSLPDGRGDGANLGRYTHAGLVEDALALLDHLGVKQSYAFGSSFGATIALAALCERPERFPRAVLQGGFARRPLAPAEVLLAGLARFWPGSMRVLPFRTPTLRRSHYGPFAHHPPDVWRYFLERWGSPPIAAVAQRALLLHRLDLRPLLGRVRQPVLLVGGDGDPLVARSCEEELLRHLIGAARVELSACGHNPLFTHPAVLAEWVRRFLTPPPCMI